MRFLKAWNKSKPLDYYSSIDELPINIWFDIHKSADFRLLLKEKSKVGVKDFINLSKVWNELYNEFIQRFGMSEDFIADLNQSIRLAELQAKFIITKKPHYKTLIKVEKAKIESTKEDIKKPFDLEIILAKMTKFYSVRMKSNDLTVSEYYSYINNITNG